MTDVNQLKTIEHQTLIDLVRAFTPAMPSNKKEKTIWVINLQKEPDINEDQ